MTLTDLQTLVGYLTNDTNHDRYPLTAINTELDNTQDDWNAEIKIIKDTITITTVDGTRQHALSILIGTPISITRVTHKGLLLSKRSKQWLDLYSGGTDWTTGTGTPKEYVIEQEDPAVQYITLHPIPQAADAGANLVVEFCLRHTAMSASSDVPFMSGTTSNNELRPYDWYLAYDVSARLLMRDPGQENAARVGQYRNIASAGKAQIIQVFKQFEQETPRRLLGGRYWNSGNLSSLNLK